MELLALATLHEFQNSLVFQSATELKRERAGMFCGGNGNEKRRRTNVELVEKINKCENVAQRGEGELPDPLWVNGRIFKSNTEEVSNFSTSKRWRRRENGCEAAKMSQEKQKKKRWLNPCDEDDFTTSTSAQIKMWKTFLRQSRRFPPTTTTALPSRARPPSPRSIIGFSRREYWWKLSAQTSSFALRGRVGNNYQSMLERKERRKSWASLPPVYFMTVRESERAIILRRKEKKKSEKLQFSWVTTHETPFHKTQFVTSLAH